MRQRPHVGLPALAHRHGGRAAPGSGRPLRRDPRPGRPGRLRGAAGRGSKAHDDALATAVEEAKPNFTQCVRCGRWVCNEICWNTKRGLCAECSPKTEVEIAAAQSEAQVEQIREKVRAKDQTKDLDLEREMVARCPRCKAQTSGGKFCPECGAPLAPKDTCVACGAKMGPSAKFCPECGEKRP